MEVCFRYLDGVGRLHDAALFIGTQREPCVGDEADGVEKVFVMDDELDIL